jgi:hypothetical protein
MSKTLTKKQIETAQLDRISVGIYKLMFCGEQERAFEPRPGTVMHKIWKMRKLNIRQQHTWARFVKDLRGAKGRSGKVCGSYAEFTNVSSSGDRLPVALTNDEYKKIEAIFTVHIGRRDALLLRDLVIDELQKPGHLQLELLGLAKNGYKNADQARAAGIATITSMIDRLADLYE